MLVLVRLTRHRRCGTCRWDQVCSGRLTLHLWLTGSLELCLSWILRASGLLSHPSRRAEGYRRRDIVCVCVKVQGVGWKIPGGSSHVECGCVTTGINVLVGARRCCVRTSHSMESRWKSPAIHVSWVAATNTTFLSYGIGLKPLQPGKDGESAISETSCAFVDFGAEGEVNRYVCWPQEKHVCLAWYASSAPSESCKLAHGMLFACSIQMTKGSCWKR